MGTALAIGLLAPPYLPVPPARYGGVERVVAYLADALVELGHEVVLFASGDSCTKAKLVPIAEQATWQGNHEEDACLTLLAVAKAYDALDGVQVMHNHAGHEALLAARASAVPTLSTVHWPLDLPARRSVYQEFREQPLAALSDAQRRALPEAGWLAVVGNGLPKHLYRFVEGPGAWLAFCGRLYPEKGVGVAMRAAIEAQVPLKIAGQIPPRESGDPWARRARAYFEAEVQPLLAHPLIEYVGELDDHEKQALYGGARALLAPADWPEPFGLVVAEALACGTPVIATPRGALPELVRDGVTGRVCEAEDLAQAIGEIGRLDRGACRAEFEARFTSREMAERYLALYGKVSGKAAAGSRKPLEMERRRRYEAHLGEVLGACGMRLDAPGTRDTPGRMLSALWEATCGYEGDDKLLTAFPNESPRSARIGEQVVEGPIPFYALCEHHVLPFFGEAYVGYVPDREVIGLSKLTRLLRLYARRFTFQERIGEQVAAELERLVGAAGVAVRLRAEHLCTQMRGVAVPGVATATTTWRGCYENNGDLRAEFHALCQKK